MLSKTIEAALNEQIKNEFYSAYYYLSMSAYFEAANLPGSAHWMRTQFGEEQTHALKLYDYVNSRNGRVTLLPIEQPPVSYDSPQEVWEQVLKHEQKVTAMIHHLYELAGKEKDYATQTMLAWFITEQVEEEKNAGLMAERFQQAGKNPANILMFDGHFTKRGV